MIRPPAHLYSALSLGTPNLPPADAFCALLNELRFYFQPRVDRIVRRRDDGPALPGQRQDRLFPL